MPTAARHQILTHREREVLSAYALFGSQADAARAMGVSLHTLKNHLTHIYKDLDVNSGIQAVWRVYVLQDKGDGQYPP